jgi:serine protease Do
VSGRYNYIRTRWADASTLRNPNAGSEHSPRLVNRMYRFCLPIALAIGLTTAAGTLRGQDRPILKDAWALQETLREIIKRAEPSVACILVSRSEVYHHLTGYEPPLDNPGKLGSFEPPKREPADPRVRHPGFGRGRAAPPPDENQKYDMANPAHVPEAFGSGIVVDGEKLLVLTAYHVVRDATKIYIRFPEGKGSYADIHAADPRSDLAVLRLLDDRIKPLPALTMGDGSSVQKGDFIVTLTNPFAAGFRDGSASASWGIVSGLHRHGAPLSAGEEDPLKGLLPLKGTLIETDARLNAGCSGGALLNLRGEMVGLTTARAAISGSETAAGFAVPLDANFKRIIDRLKSGQEVEYGFLGIAAPSPSARGDGLMIGGPDHRSFGVTPGSPAAKANLLEGEVIKSINGMPLRDFEDLFMTVGTLMAGSEARLEVVGRPNVVRVELAKSYVPGKIIASNRARAVRGFRVDYTSVLFLSQSSMRWFGFPRGIQPGVYVREVLPDSPAANARLKVNEIITHINGQAVNSPAEFYEATRKLPVNASLELTLATSDFNNTRTSTLTIH